MAKFPPLMLAPPLIFAGFVALAAVGMFGRDDSLEAVRVGQIAPAVTPEALPGYAGVTSEDFARGEVTLVNFWASWCPPCRAEHPRLLELEAAGVPIIGVNFRDTAANAGAYLEEADSPFVAVPFDPEGRTAFDWGVTAPPETFILDAEGRVVYRFIGPLVGSDFEQRFMPEFEKAQALPDERAVARTPFWGVWRAFWSGVLGLCVFSAMICATAGFGVYLENRRSDVIDGFHPDVSIRNSFFKSIRSSGFPILSAWRSAQGMYSLCLELSRYGVLSIASQRRCERAAAKLG